MDSYLGEIRIFAGNYAPEDWAFCDGSTLQISQYDALYSLLGTRYGGDGKTTFALPNLQGMVVVGQGKSTIGTSYTLGQTGGVSTVTLVDSQMPAHSHPLNATTQNGIVTDPKNALLAVTQTGQGYPDAELYSPLPSLLKAPNATLDLSTCSAEGGNQPHTNMQPFMVICYIICIKGMYPNPPQ